MRITGPGNTTSASARKAGRKDSSSDGAFAAAVDAPDEASSPAKGGTAAGPVAAVDALLALQEAPDASRGRSRGLDRAGAMLGLLEEVRRGLLVGTIPRATLGQLARLARESRQSGLDPALTAILDDIELRAEVELAKLEREA